MSPAKRRKSTMTNEHKAALAEGRAQGRAVRLYLDALEAHRPKRGRKRTPDSMKKRLAQVEEEIPQASPLQRVQLIQERMDLTSALTNVAEPVDISELEQGFIEAAKPYSERKGITYAAWRELGIPPAVLREAGIGRGA